MSGDARRYHPLAVLQIFSKTWVLLLAPLLRALVVFDLDALWLALQQDALLGGVLLGYSYVAWRKTHWQYTAAPCPRLTLRRGVFLREVLCLTAARCTLVCLERNILLRLMGASRVMLHYQTPATRGTARLQALTLTLPKQDAIALIGLLLPEVIELAALPKQSLRRRSVWAFFWQSGGLFVLAAIGCIVTAGRGQGSAVAFGAAMLFYGGQVGMSGIGFCKEGIWQMCGYTQLFTQDGFTTRRYFLRGALPATQLSQSPFARRAGRATLTLYPVKGKNLKIRSVLLKIFALTAHKN